MAKQKNKNWLKAKAFAEQTKLGSIVYYKEGYYGNEITPYIVMKTNFETPTCYWDIGGFNADFTFCKSRENSKYHYIELRYLRDPSKKRMVALHPTMKKGETDADWDSRFVTEEEANKQAAEKQERTRLYQIKDKKENAAAKAFQGITYENGWFAGMVGRTQWGNREGRFTRQVMDYLVQLFEAQNIDYDNLSRSNADWSFLHNIGLDASEWNVGSEGFQTNFVIRDGHKFQAQFLPEAVPYQQKWEADPAYKLDCGEAEGHICYANGSVEQILAQHSLNVSRGWGDFLFTIYNGEGKTYWAE